MKNCNHILYVKYSFSEELIAVLNKVRYALCPMPYALCPRSESTSCY
ncbi:hypothetical protein [Microcoleus sp.]